MEVGSLAEERALSLSGDKAQDPSHISNYIWCHPQMGSSREESWGPRKYVWEVRPWQGKMQSVPTSLALAQFL